MTTISPAFDLACQSALGARTELIREVQGGFHSRPRSLKPWMLYDELGSRLFEQITALPEYYPTRTERSLLESSADAIVASACADSQPLRVVELGAGTASKTCLLLAAAARRRIDVIYMPLDVSADALGIACRGIESAFPEVLLEPVVVNYVNRPPRLEEFDGSTLALYLGSSIGNFMPQESRTILRNIGSQLRNGDALVLGTDLVKEESTLIAAYDDNEGVTAAFNLNVLNRLNNEPVRILILPDFGTVPVGIPSRPVSRCTSNACGTNTFRLRVLNSSFTLEMVKPSIRRTATNSPIILLTRSFPTRASRLRAPGKIGVVGTQSRSAGSKRISAIESKCEAS